MRNAVIAALLVILFFAGGFGWAQTNPKDSEYAHEFLSMFAELIGDIESGSLVIKDIPHARIDRLKHSMKFRPLRVAIEGPVQGTWSEEGVADPRTNRVRISRGNWIDSRRSRIYRAAYTLRRLCELLELDDSQGAISNPSIKNIYALFGKDLNGTINRATADPWSFRKNLLEAVIPAEKGFTHVEVNSIFPYQLYVHYSEVYQQVESGIALPPGECEVDSQTLAFVDRAYVTQAFHYSYKDRIALKNPKEKNPNARLDWWPLGVGTTISGTFFGMTGEAATIKYQLRIAMPKTESENRHYHWVRLSRDESDASPTVIGAFSVDTTSRNLKTWMYTDEGWFEIPHLLLDDHIASMPDREHFVDSKIKDPYQRFQPNRIYKIFQHIENHDVWVAYLSFIDDNEKLQLWQVGLETVVPGSFLGLKPNHGANDKYMAVTQKIPEAQRDGLSEAFPYWTVWKKVDPNTPTNFINAISGGFRTQDPSTGKWQTGRFTADDRDRLWKRYMGEVSDTTWDPDNPLLNPSINEIDRLHAERIRESLQQIKKTQSMMAFQRRSDSDEWELKRLENLRGSLFRKLNFLELQKSLGFPKLKHPYMPVPNPPPFDWRAYFGIDF